MQSFRLNSLVLSAAMAFWLLLLSFSSFAALPVDVEQDRYLLAAKRYYDEQRLDKVNEYLTKVEAINKQPAALFYYLKSEVLASKRQLSEQSKALEKYVELAGKEGEFYAKALNTLTDIEEQQHQASKPIVKPQLTAAKDSQPSISQNEYVQRLQKLYLVNDEKTALVMHINTLLGNLAYTGSRLQNAAQQASSIQYSISVDATAQIVTLKKDRSRQPEKLTTTTVNIFGKSLWLTHDCQYQQAQCTIRLPDSIDAWFMLSYDEKATQELTTALEHLIRLLQKTETPA